MEDKFEQLFQSIKAVKPVLNNPDKLTDSIMEQIEQKTMLQVSPLLIWARIALCSAAVLLFGLFFIQQNEAQESTMASTNSKINLKNKMEMDSTCMQLLSSEHVNIVKTYLCYLQKNSIENKLNKSYPLQKN